MKLLSSLVYGWRHSILYYQIFPSKYLKNCAFQLLCSLGKVVWLIAQQNMSRNDEFRIKDESVKSTMYPRDRNQWGPGLQDAAAG